VQPAFQLLVACLRAHGARRVFGAPLGDLQRIDVADASLAGMLADADGRLGGIGVAFDAATRHLRLSSLLDGPTDVTDVLDSPRQVIRIVETAARTVARTHATRVIALDLALDAPVASNASPIGARDYVPYAGAVVPRQGRTAMLVGPYVIRRGAVGGLRDFVAAANVGVANTWGAKGVFAWDSPNHMGTVGLQAADLELVFEGIDTVIATGLDGAETRPPLPDDADVVPVDPQQLASLARHAAPAADIAANPLYRRLAEVAQTGYRDPRYPYHPARVVALLRDRVPAGGVVTADPGRVGFWVARTFPTSELGGVVVPATGGAGAGAALALACALRGRPAIAAVDVSMRDHGSTDEIVRLAAEIGHPIELMGWGGDDLPIDWSPTDDLAAVAGEVVAWS